MTIQPRVKTILNSLAPELESEHFIIHYGLRNPPTGKGLGVHGVRDKILILTYVTQLESLYKTMTSRPWNRSTPIVDSTGKSHVYVLDSVPFTYFDRNLIPFVALPCRSGEPTTQAELHRAAAEAVHEATHLFNYTKRPMYDPYSDAWEWFDEGMAMLMEMVVASGNHDYFRFLTNWIDMPEISLDAPVGKYQAGMFVRYLARTLGVDFINSVWLNSDVGETPIAALQRLAPSSQKFVSASPTEDDIFASGYCIDPYFMWDHQSVGVAPDVFARYGGRAVSESLMLAAGERAKFGDGLPPRELNHLELDHLACRYYRIFLAHDVSHLDVEVWVTDPPDQTPLKAELAVITRSMRRSTLFRSNPTHANVDGFSGRLSIVASGLTPRETDHLVLVVSNCGTRSASNYPGGPHDDGKRYQVYASAS